MKHSQTIITDHTPYRPPYAESPNSQTLLTENHICKHRRITHQRHNPWASHPAHRYSIPATPWPAKAHKSASHQPWQKMGFPAPKTPTSTTKHETIRTHKCCQSSADGTICGDASQLRVLRNPRSRNRRRSDNIKLLSNGGRQKQRKARFLAQVLGQTFFISHICNQEELIFWDWAKVGPLAYFQHLRSRAEIRSKWLSQL